MIHAGAKLFTQGQFPFDKDISKHQSRQRRIKNDGKVVNRGAHHLKVKIKDSRKAGVDQTSEEHQPRQNLFL